MRNTQQLKDWLVSQGYTGSVNSALRSFLNDKGYTKQLSQAYNEWLGNQGYTGNFNLKQRQFYKAVFGLSLAYTPADFDPGDGLTVTDVSYSGGVWTVEMTDGSTTESADFTDAEMAQIEAGTLTGFVREAQVSETSSVYTVDEEPWSFSADGSSVEFQYQWILDDVEQSGETGTSYDASSVPGLTYRKVSLEVISNIGGSIETVVQTATAYSSPLVVHSGTHIAEYTNGIGIAEGATAGVDRVIYAGCGYMPLAGNPSGNPQIWRHFPFSSNGYRLYIDTDEKIRAIGGDSINTSTFATTAINGNNSQLELGENFAYLIMAQNLTITTLVRSGSGTIQTSTDTISATDQFFFNGDLQYRANTVPQRSFDVWVPASDVSYTPTDLFNLMFDTDNALKHPGIIRDALALGDPFISNRGDATAVLTNGGTGPTSTGSSGTTSDYSGT